MQNKSLFIFIPVIGVAKCLKNLCMGFDKFLIKTCPFSEKLIIFAVKIKKTTTNTIMKKLLVAIFMLLPLTASAWVEYNNLFYELDKSDQTAMVIISQKDLPYSGAITIPETILSNDEEYTVTSIKESAFENCTGLTSITIPSSVKNIGECAFADCTGLTSVTISPGVNTLERGAFYGCNKLTSVKIPEGVKTIGVGAFSKCSSLAYLYIPNSVTTIENYAFDYCTSLSYIVSAMQLPIDVFNTVFETHDALYSVYEMATLIIPDGTRNEYLTSAGWNLFHNIYEISQQEVRTINVANAGTLSAIVSDMEREQQQGFILTGSLNGTDFKFIHGMESLKNLDLSEANIVKGGEAYLGDNLFITKANSMPTKLLSSLTTLESVVLPNSVTQVASDILLDCPSLISIEVGSDNQHYDSRDGCNAVVETSSNNLIIGCKKTVIPNTVSSIGSDAFYGCTDLVSITIPSSVVFIGSDAFSGCNRLTSVVSEIETPFGIGNNVFYSSDKDIYATAVLIVPKNKKSDYQAVDGWKKFANIVEQGEGGFAGQIIENDGIYYKVGDKGTVAVTSGENKYTGSVVIPYEISFNGIQYSVTTIGSEAFNSCSLLTSVSIPKSVTTIASGTFKNCSGLASVIVDGENPNYDSRNNCNAIIEKSSKTLIAGCKNTVIPNTVETIGESAFFGCSDITTITIPNSVTSISNNAFQECNGLTSIVSEIDKPFAIGDNVFYSSDIDIYTTATLLIPKGTRASYLKTDGWKKFTNIVESGGYGFQFEKDNISYRIGENNTVAVTQKKNKYSGDVVIPSQVTYQETVYTVTGIEDNAFANKCTDMTSITIPATVTSIGEAAFYDYLTKLTAVHITDLEAWCKISFNGSSEESNPLRWAHHLYLNGKEVTDLIIPTGITTINKGAFYGCTGLTSATIHKGVTSIGSEAFYGCNNLVRIVSYRETPPACENNSLYSQATCTVWVPAGASVAYKEADQWKDKVIKEINGDVNLDNKVNKSDRDALIDHIMGKNPEGFYQSLADLNGDGKVNAADLVMLIKQLASYGLSYENQVNIGTVDGNQVITSLTCKLINGREESVQLTKCELYCNQELISFMNFSSGSNIIEAGGNKSYTFENVGKPVKGSTFTVCWYYTASGESFVYRCNLTN